MSKVIMVENTMMLREEGYREVKIVREIYFDE